MLKETPPIRQSNELIDRGFDGDFDAERVREICAVFGSESELQAVVDRIHEQDGILDMKRGELYPEILRCVSTMKRTIANAYGVEPEQCLPNFGCNGCIDSILMAVKLREVRQGVNARRQGGVLISTPTYFRNYGACRSKELRMLPVPLVGPQWELDLDAVLAQMKRARPSVVFLVTPNNPTGMPISDATLLRILDAAPRESLVVIDRTLVNLRDEVSTEQLLHRHAGTRLAILHSFSKYKGMSHLRIGFAVCASLELAEEIRPHLPLGLCLEGVLKATRFLIEEGTMRPSEEIVDNIRRSKAVLEDFQVRNPAFSLSDFSANYCLLGLPEGLEARGVAARLEEGGIYVLAGPDFPEPLEGVLRIHAGGDPELMRRTVAALEDRFG